MRQASAPATAGWRNPFTSRDISHGSLSKVVYRSRAVRTLPPAELHELTRSSVVRNEREAITGLMLYDDNRFFQWLEGPPDNVGRLMDSIQNDRRHTDIEILSKQPVEGRAFGGWNMKLATPGPVSPSWRQEVIEPPREIVDGLRKRPEAAPALLARLVPLAEQRARGVAAEQMLAQAVADMPLHRKTADVLRQVFLAAVLPALGGLPDSDPRPRLVPPHPRAGDLAALLVSADPEDATTLVHELHRLGATIPAMSAAVFEPAARILGDMWSEDTCTEFDVTLGLCRLQSVISLLAARTDQRLPSQLAQPLVLIAPEPGELHRLGAALDGTVLRQAGWEPSCEYPSDDQALQEMLAATWFDVLDLSLSAAFRRDNQLAHVKSTIAEARQVSRNPALVVVVAGRVFAEERAAGQTVGADHANTTSLNVDRTILRTVSEARTRTETASSQVVATPS